MMGPRQRRVVVAGFVLLVVAVTALALVRRHDTEPAPGLTVGWSESEGHPGCLYDPATKSVDVTLVVKGRAPRAGTVSVTVTAYADENTSVPVGSSTSTVSVDGTMDQPLLMTIAVDRKPHVDEDGVAACRLEVEGAKIGSG